MNEITETKIFQEPALVEDASLIFIKTMKAKHVDQMRNMNYSVDMEEIPGEAIGYFESYDCVIFKGGGELIFKMAAIDIVQFFMAQYVRQLDKEELKGEEFAIMREKSREAAWEWIFDLPQLFTE